MTVMEDFVEWFDRIRPEFDHIRGILSEKLSDEPEKLISDLQDAEAWNARCYVFLAESNSYLDRAAKQLMPTRDGRTQLDLKIDLDSRLSTVRLIRDKCEGLCNSIKQRLILGESILSYSKQFAERKPKDNTPW